MGQTECGQCESVISAGTEVYDNVTDEFGIDGHTGCSDCSAHCTDCHEVFYTNALKTDDREGHWLCEECWNERFSFH